MFSVGQEYRLHKRIIPSACYREAHVCASFITEDQSVSLNFLCLSVAGNTFKIILQTPKPVKGSLPSTQRQSRTVIVSPYTVLLYYVLVDLMCFASGNIFTARRSPIAR